jgi:hypothetical protein
VDGTVREGALNRGTSREESRVDGVRTEVEPGLLRVTVEGAVTRDTSRDESATDGELTQGRAGLLRVAVEREGCRVGVFLPGRSGAALISRCRPTSRLESDGKVMPGRIGILVVPLPVTSGTLEGWVSTVRLPGAVRLGLASPGAGLGASVGVVGSVRTVRADPVSRDVERAEGTELPGEVVER